MSAALELAPRWRVRTEHAPRTAWKLVALAAAPAAAAWTREVSALFERGAVAQARRLVERLPASCDGPDRDRWSAALVPLPPPRRSPASGGTAEAFDWLARESTPFRGQWVFLDHGRLVDHDRSVEQLCARHADDVSRSWTLVCVETDP